MAESSSTTNVYISDFTGSKINEAVSAVFTTIQPALTTCTERINAISATLANVSTTMASVSATVADLQSYKPIIIKNAKANKADWGQRQGTTATTYQLACPLLSTSGNSITCNNNDYFEVIFNESEATSGIFSPVAETDNENKIFIYASTTPTNNITIPAVIIFKGDEQ